MHPFQSFCVFRSHGPESGSSVNGSLRGKVNCKDNPHWYSPEKTESFNFYFSESQILIGTVQEDGKQGIYRCEQASIAPTPVSR